MVESVFIVAVVVLFVFALSNLFGVVGPDKAWIPALIAAIVLALLLALVPNL